ncbi:phosphate transport system substrate-binding protein [Aurantimicrobium minutum]|uniref:phosphate ABC transporter substrate-binding protein PstS n=1 Tax=Aurantimicrobium minutum TaxID=708131 RepID=UPI0024075598|nr:phosphate ABC transporter substrate-binding protein PstS [Aurantimicrobium minutum]MDF9809686.1 phosphate transport system substrate-binding protein [Aurantimicrobium minutum]
MNRFNKFRGSLRKTALSVVAVSAVALFSLSAGGPASATSYAPISGTGSTWSQNALDQWRKNVAANYGMTVNYSGVGSSAGRRDYIAGTVDFAVSEIPFQANPEDGSTPEVPPRGFAYMPIVAGGTSFMYNLKIGGQQVTNLRLSGEVISKIFSGSIKKWNDPAIQSDNPGLAMPDKSIVPVVRSDGSGSTAQFTLWMSTQHSGIWSRGMTSQFPTIDGFKYQSGSSGVSGYVSQDYGEGAITYVEYSYAVQSGFPVVKVLNNAGYYIEPTASSVAVALLQAGINSDLTQNLNGVYNNADPRTYPLSSYSYMIVPTETGGVFTAEKGATLGAFGQYMLCEGQQQAEALGYSPLPMNLVMAGFDQIKRIPGASGVSVDLNSCNNPTFKPGDSPSSNALAATAPQPAECDKQGADQCTTGTGGASQETAISGSGAGGSSAGAGSSAAAAGKNGTKAGATGVNGAVGSASPFFLDEEPWGGRQSMMLAAGGLLLTAVALPPYLIRRKSFAENAKPLNESTSSENKP